MVGDRGENALYGIKRIAATSKKVTSTLEIDAPSQPGDHKLVLYLMSDSYVGCDQEFEFFIHVS